MTFFTISVFLFFFILVLILADQLGKFLWSTGKQNEAKALQGPRHKIGDLLSNTGGYTYLMLGLAVLGLMVFLYSQLAGSPYEGHIKEWMNLLVRWVHITFGIAWIGTSFYFVFLENSLNRTKGLRDGIAGNLWSVHGGGFYYIEKYKVAPEKIPEELHWFKYEAYFTWLSGFLLLCVVYYLNANSYLIDKQVMELTPSQGVAIGIGMLIFGWLLYDLVCKTPIVKNGMLFAILGFLVITGFAWAFTQVFAPRAAYIHVGALLGTFMAGNVFFVIIPAQKAMVNAAIAGKEVDARLGQNARLRSFHNNYMTLPVLFIMISNHFPSTFGHEYNWAILAAISLASAIFKHFLNIIESGRYAAWVFPIAAMMMMSIVFMTAPDTGGKCDSKIAFSRVYNIINERCTTCHSSRPTDKVWSSPPNGVVYDTPEDIQKMSEKIMQRVVITKNMPQNNQTGMTEKERELVRCWIMQGAKIE